MFCSTASEASTADLCAFAFSSASYSAAAWSATGTNAGASSDFSGAFSPSGRRRRWPDARRWRGERRERVRVCSCSSSCATALSFASTTASACSLAGAGALSSDTGVCFSATGACSCTCGLSSFTTGCSTACSVVWTCSALSSCTRTFLRKLRRWRRTLGFCSFGSALAFLSDLGAVSAFWVASAFTCVLSSVLRSGRLRVLELRRRLLRFSFFSCVSPAGADSFLVSVSVVRSLRGLLRGLLLRRRWLLLRRRLSLPRLLLVRSWVFLSEDSCVVCSLSFANNDLIHLPNAVNKPILAFASTTGAAFAAACGAGVEGITTPLSFGSSRTGAAGDLDISNASGSGATTCS